MENYEVELYYGFEDSETGIYHAFQVVDPAVKADDNEMAKLLAEQLDRDPEDESFTCRSMYIRLPDSLISKIKAQAIQEYQTEQSKKAQQPNVRSFGSDSDAVNLFSVNDVVHTLKQLSERMLVGSNMDYMITFASELTGISEDVLMDKMYDSRALEASEAENAVKLEVGMTGTIKATEGIKKDLRGRSFVVTDVDDSGTFAYCSIEGKKGTYSVLKVYMENLSPAPAKAVEPNFDFGDLVNFEGRTWVIDKVMGPNSSLKENRYVVLPLEYQDPDKYDELVFTGRYDDVSRFVLQSELTEVSRVEQVILSEPKAALGDQIQAAANRTVDKQREHDSKSISPAR